MDNRYIDKTGIIFEWDSSKNLANYKKHGISFEVAVEAFQDKQGIYLIDKDHSWEEERFHFISSIANTALVLIVFTEKNVLENKVLRIISARKTTKRERKIYAESGRET